jgi:molybdopterin/thiamine biosynthesis adenylyltransferase
MSVNRISGAIWHKSMQDKTVVLVGAGATGSMAGFFVSRLGIKKIDIIDFDTFEPHNCHTQLTGYSEIGMYKANSLSDLISQKCPSVKYINSHIKKIQQIDLQSFPKSTILICAADSMDARKYCYQMFRELDFELFIDPRISAEYCEIYSLTGTNKSNDEAYKERLFDESRGTVGDCNYQQSTHCAGIAGGLIAQIITNHVTNQLIDEDDLPLKLTYDLRSAIFTNSNVY